MKDEYLDKVIKDYLEHFDAGSPGDSWQFLKMKLASVDANNNDFDRVIKSKLEQLDPKHDKSTWLALASALDLIENVDSVNEELIIEDKIKSSLAQFEVPYQANTWDELEAKIDLDESLANIEIPEEVDLLAFEKLNEINAGYNPSHWNIFEPLLDKEFYSNNKLLLRTKAVELSLLLLLLLGIGQFLPGTSVKNEPSNLELATHDENEIDFLKIEVSSNNNRSSNALGAIISNKLQDSPKQKEFAQESQYLTKGINDLIFTQKRKKAGQLSFIKETPIAAQNESALAANKAFRENIVAAKIEQNKFLVESKDEVHHTLSQNIMPNKEVSKQLNLLNTLGFKLFNIPKGDESLNCVACKNPVSLLKWRLSAGLTADYNYIRTPYDKALSVDSYSHAAVGYGAGLGTSLGIGNWELELGANYISRKYTPKPIQEKVGNIVEGYLRVELDKIELNLLQVPLHIRYYFSSEKKAQFYLSGGASMNVAMQANYYRTSEFASRVKKPNFNESKRLFDETITNSKKIYSLGWLDGGSFSENRYFTVDLGLGFERKISNRYSLFGQANYQQYLDEGIGPNKDRFNSLSLSLGARALFR